MKHMIVIYFHWVPSFLEIPFVHNYISRRLRFRPLGQNAQAETPSPANHSTHFFDFTITLICGTSYNSHILSMNCCTSLQVSILGHLFLFLFQTSVDN